MHDLRAQRRVKGGGSSLTGGSTGALKSAFDRPHPRLFALSVPNSELSFYMDPHPFTRSRSTLDSPQPTFPASCCLHAYLGSPLSISHSWFVGLTLLLSLRPSLSLCPSVILEVAYRLQRLVRSLADPLSFVAESTPSEANETLRAEVERAYGFAVAGDKSLADLFGLSMGKKKEGPSHSAFTTPGQAPAQFPIVFHSHHGRKRARGRRQRTTRPRRTMRGMMLWLKQLSASFSLFQDLVVSEPTGNLSVEYQPREQCPASAGYRR